MPREHEVVFHVLDGVTAGTSFLAGTRWVSAVPERNRTRILFPAGTVKDSHHHHHHSPLYRLVQCDGETGAKRSRFTDYRRRGSIDSSFPTRGDIEMPTPNACFISVAMVSERTSLSRSVIYKLAKEGKFPKSVIIASRAARWVSDEVDAWCAERIARRDAA